MLLTMRNKKSIVTKLCLIVAVIFISKNALDFNERYTQFGYDHIDYDDDALSRDSYQQLQQDYPLPVVTELNPKVVSQTGEGASERAGGGPDGGAVDHAVVDAWSSRRPAFQKLSDTSASTYVSLLRRIVLNKLRRHTSGYHVATLLDLIVTNNKGDPAIAIGQLTLLSELDISVVHYDCQKCHNDNPYLNQLGPDVMMILAGGGGTIGVYLLNDKSREKALMRYRAYKYVMMGQSGYIHTRRDASYLGRAYSNHPDVTFMLRDLNTYRMCLQYMPSVHSVLTPDMAFGLGSIPRFFTPTMDIIWINRHDHETVRYSKPVFPDDVTYLVEDWYDFLIPDGQNMIDTAYVQTYAGFLFLQRAHVVVTDRLHGLILATLLSIPVVAIDNKFHKTANYMETWLEGMDNVLLAKDTEDAVAKAMHLLRRVKNALSSSNK